MNEDKRLNEIIRVRKRPNNFVTMDKGFLENSSLSWKAKGILAYLLSKPDNWKVIIKDLVSHSTDGKAAVYSGLNELKAQGYYQKVPVRDKDGRRISHWEGTISEVPMESLVNTGDSLLPDFQEIDNQDIENQDLENQYLENQYLENREHSNNYLSNNDFSKINNSPVMSCLSEKTGPEACADFVRGNINYPELLATRPHEAKLVDDIVAIIVDALLSEGGPVRVGGEDKPRELVKHHLIRLGYDDIEHVLEQFSGLTERISKKRQYLLTMLYNSKMETEAHYVNLVASREWE